VINNSEENENEVEGYVALQGNIYYQVLENLFVEEALVILSLNYFIVFVSIYKEQLIVVIGIIDNFYKGCVPFPRAGLFFYVRVVIRI
jgi:hypothetical protein